MMETIIQHRPYPQW